RIRQGLASSRADGRKGSLLEDREVGADDLRRVEKLFHAALNRKPEERMEFLAKACRRDPETRAKVESLLAARQDAGSFLERPAISLGENALSLIGRRVGRY